MSHSYQGGALFHGEFASSDASALTETNARFALYGAGQTTALTLDSNDEVVVTFLKVMVGSSALTVTVYDGANNTVAAGETIDAGSYAANGGAVMPMDPPHVCQKGTYPKVLTSGAGEVKAYIRGYIRRKSG